MSELTPPEEGWCCLCSEPYPVWYAPNELWNAVTSESLPFLCPSCFAHRVEDAGIAVIRWSFTPEVAG